MRSAPRVCSLPLAGCARAGRTAERVRIQADAGALRITAFSAPEPLRVGAADLSVLVQQREGGAPVLDAEVALAARGPGAGAADASCARRAQPRRTSSCTPPASSFRAAGDWTLRVSVRRGEQLVEVAGALPVAPPPPRLASLWPYLALPPAAVALFALREWLVARRMRA